MAEKRIFLSLAHMSGAEQSFIQSAFETNWVAPLGPNVSGFERDLENFLGENSRGNADRRVVALSAGTAAIHLGLLQLGVCAGDEVICQSFTFAASANPIVYCGATPIFVDSERDTWNLDPALLKAAIEERISKTGKKPKAIVAVDLYGMPAKLDEILDVAQRFEIPVLEDAAEALGSEFRGKKCGTFGEFGALSFNGNKMITTSGGGALICKNEKIAAETLFYATQARENFPYYFHEKIGYNYRLSNVSAGIGRGQMTVLRERISRRREIHKIYENAFAGTPGIEIQKNPTRDFDSNFWLTCILVDPEKFGETADEIRLRLENENIESRRFWRPMHMQPIFKNAQFFGTNVAEKLFENGLCLPSGTTLSNEEIALVVEKILKK